MKKTDNRISDRSFKTDAWNCPSVQLNSIAWDTSNSLLYQLRAVNWTKKLRSYATFGCMCAERHINLYLEISDGGNIFEIYRILGDIRIFVWTWIFDFHPLRKREIQGFIMLNKLLCMSISDNAWRILK